MNRRTTLVGLVAAVIVVAGGVALALAWRTRPPEVLLASARIALKSGDLAQAQRLAEQLRSAGELDHARLLQAELLLQRQAPVEALGELNRIRDQGDLRRQGAVVAGQCLLQLGNLREAERAFLFVVSEQPDNVDGHRGLGAVYFDQGALWKALHHLDEVARLDPKDGRPHRAMGLINADLDRREEAVAAYREALRRSLPSAAVDEVSIELAEQLAKLADHEAALEVLGPASSAVWAESARKLAIRAECEWALGRREEATRRLEAGLVEYPREVALLRLRGRLLGESGDWKRAVPLLEQAAAADPHEMTTQHQLSLAYDRVQRPQDAERCRARVKQIQADLTALTDLNREADQRPWDGDVRLRLAEVCDRIGRTDLAAMWRTSAALCQ